MPSFSFIRSVQGNRVGKKPQHRLIILGPKTSGKSSFGNILLNERAFKINRYDEGPSDDFKPEEMKGVEIATDVVDTPSTLTDDHYEIIKKYGEDEKIRTTYIVVIPFYQDTKKYFDTFKSKLGYSILEKEFILAITYIDELQVQIDDNSEDGYAKYLKKNNKNLHSLMTKYKDRRLFVSNTDTKEGKQDTRERLLEMLKQHNTEICK